MRNSLIAVSLVLLPVLAGCGGASDESKIRDVIALGNKHDPKVCERVTDKWLKSVTGGGKEDCQRLVKQTGTAKFKVRKVTVKGDRATVDGSIRDKTGQLLLVKDGGDWKLDDARPGG
ncbi:MAG: hypothetical protein ABR581_10525 [Thermoleophilaceae bacterium]